VNLVYGLNMEVAQWTSAHIPHMAGVPFGPGVAIGVENGGKLIAGIVFHDWQPRFKTMQVSMAATDPKWAARGVILKILSYPFDEVKVEKLWAAMPYKNERAIRFNTGIGFVREGTLSRHFGTDHAVIARMFRKDYERLKDKWNGQKLAAVAA